MGFKRNTFLIKSKIIISTMKIIIQMELEKDKVLTVVWYLKPI